MSHVKISGLGRAVPSYAMTNEGLTQFVETSDEWIRSRTGIGARYISQGETTTELAIQAGKEAVAAAGINAEALDMIIVATITPDSVMPSTACLVQAALGAKNATAFDLTAACSGFIYGARIARDALNNEETNHILVIGAEVLTKTVDWADRSTCVLFGDGAGAAIFSKNHKNNIISLYTGSDGSLGQALTLPGRPVHNCLVQNTEPLAPLYMDGKEVYRFATTVVPQSINKVVEGTAYTLEEIDWFVLHQANSRIMDSVAKKLKVNPDKFFKNLETYGNTSAASIPMALYELQEQLKAGDKIILSGFGGGLTWGSMFIIWE